MAETQEFNQIIRLLNTDINGNIKTKHALTKIHGVSFMLSNALCNLTSLNKNKKIGELSPEDIKKIETALKSDSLPEWILNRRNDLESGESKHLTGPDLKFQKEQDIKQLRKIKCYRGVRHSLGLPVRGQRTKGNFRKGKTVGVRKKSLKSASGKK
jgi:small subunit ribosomal protein S13